MMSLPPRGREWTIYVCPECNRPAIQRPGTSNAPIHTHENRVVNFERIVVIPKDES